MATVNFVANGFAANEFATTSVVYYLQGEHYEALLNKEKEQSLVKMRSYCCQGLRHHNGYAGLSSTCA